MRFEKRNQAIRMIKYVEMFTEYKASRGAGNHAPDEAITIIFPLLVLRCGIAKWVLYTEPQKLVS